MLETLCFYVLFALIGIAFFILSYAIKESVELLNKRIDNLENVVDSLGFMIAEHRYEHDIEQDTEESAIMMAAPTVSTAPEGEKFEKVLDEAVGGVQ